MLILPTLLKTPAIIGGGGYTPNYVSIDGTTGWSKDAGAAGSTNGFTFIMSYIMTEPYFTNGVFFRFGLNGVADVMYCATGGATLERRGAFVSIRSLDAVEAYYNNSIPTTSPYAYVPDVGEPVVTIVSVLNNSISVPLHGVTIASFINGVQVFYNRVYAGNPTPAGDAPFNTQHPLGIGKYYEGWNKLDACKMDRISIWTDPPAIDLSIEANYRELVQPNGVQTSEAQTNAMMGKAPEVYFGGGAAGWNGPQQGTWGQANGLWTRTGTYYDA